MSALEVVSFLGKLLCAVAALKAALYLLRRVCLAMAWKSGGASHSELIHNLRSESGGGWGGGAARAGPLSPQPRGGGGGGRTVTGRTHFAFPRRPPSRQLSRSSAGGGRRRRRRPGGGGVCLGVRSGPSREGAASSPAAVPQPRRGRWRRPLAQGGPGLLLREEMRREGRRRWRSRRGSAVRRPWLFVSPPFPPLPRPRPAILPGPLPAASSPPARNALVRAEAEPRWRRQLRRARDPPHAPGSVSFWLGSGRLCRVSAPAGVGGERPVRPLAGRAGEGWCRRARSGRPPVLQAPAKRSRSCPGLGKAPKRLRLFLLGERSVWQQSAREVRNARFWPQSRVAPFEEGG